MGCNMYVLAERKVAGNWQMVAADDLYDGRRSVVFGQLAGVRNYEELEPLAEPRGVPTDISAAAMTKVGAAVEENCVISWLTLAELEQQDWTAFSDEWEETDFSIDTMTKLRDLADGRPDDLRMIFWFDDTYADLQEV